MARHQQIIRTIAYAWALPKRNGGLQLCNWAEPTKEVLERESAEEDTKTSPDAVMVKVAIIPETELKDLLRREKEVSERERRCAVIEYGSDRATVGKEGGQ